MSILCDINETFGALGMLIYTWPSIAKCIWLPLIKTWENDQILLNSSWKTLGKLIAKYRWPLCVGITVINYCHHNEGGCL